MNWRPFVSRILSRRDESPAERDLVKRQEREAAATLYRRQTDVQATPKERPWQRRTE